MKGAHERRFQSKREHRENVRDDQSKEEKNLTK